MTTLTPEAVLALLLVLVFALYGAWTGCRDLGHFLARVEIRLRPAARTSNDDYRPPRR